MENSLVAWICVYAKKFSRNWLHHHTHIHAGENYLLQDFYFIITFLVNIPIQINLPYREKFCDSYSCFVPACDTNQRLVIKRDLYRCAVSCMSPLYFHTARATKVSIYSYYGWCYASSYYRYILLFMRWWIIYTSFMHQKITRLTRYCYSNCLKDLYVNHFLYFWIDMHFLTKYEKCWNDLLTALLVICLIEKSIKSKSITKICQFI